MMELLSGTAMDLTSLISFSIKIQTTLTILIPNCLSASCTTFELSLASMIRQAALVPRSNAKEDSVSDGALIGAGYRQPLTFADLAFNAAYSNRTARINSTRLLPGDMKPESDGSGFIKDAALNVPLTPPLGLTVNLNYQSFEYSDWNDFYGNPVPVTTPEKLTTLRFGIYASF